MQLDGECVALSRLNPMVWKSLSKKLKSPDEILIDLADNSLDSHPDSNGPINLLPSIILIAMSLSSKRF